MWRKVLVVLVTAGVMWAEKPLEKGHILPAQLLLSQPKVHNTVQFTRQRPTQSAPVIYGRDTLAFWDFEVGAQGWYAVDGNSDGATWNVGTTSDLSSYTPPNYGTQYAYYSDDDAGGGVGGEEYWISTDTLYIGDQSSLALSFGWGYRTFDGTDTLFAMVNFKQASGWTGWYIVWMHTPAEGNGNGNASVDLASYLPSDSTIVAFGYWDRNPGGWNWAVGVDNVALTTTPPQIWDESIQSVSHTPTIKTATAWVDTVTLRNEGNQDNTFNLYYEIYDTLGNLVANYTINNFYHPYDPANTDTFAVFNITGLNKGFYTITIYHDLANENNTSNDTFNTYVLALNNYKYNGQDQVLVCDVDPALFNTSTTGGGYAGQSGVHLALLLDDMGYIVNWMWGVIPSFSPYSLVMVTHGVYGTLWALPSALVTQMQSHLQGGHKAYCEGGDIWGWSGIWENGSTDQALWDSLFGIDASNTLDGSSDLSTIYGHPSTLIPGVDGKQWSNDGENSYMDRLALLGTYNGVLEAFLQNDDVGYNCGVAFHNADYDYYTVATDFELAFANAVTREDPILIRDILRDGLKEDPVAVAETHLPDRPVVSLKVSGLTRNTASLEFTLPAASDVQVDLYNLAGQKVRTLTQGTFSAGTHTLQANLDHLSSGVYFVVLKAQNLTLSQRLVLVR